MKRAQATVEFALIFPVLLFTIVVGIEAGFVFLAKFDQDHRTIVVAEWAASHPGESWNAVAAYELPGCDVTAANPRPDVVEVTATCQYRARIPIWPGTKMTSSASAASEPASPTSSPSASPSSLSTSALGRPLG